MYYPTVCIMQLLKIACYRVIALFTLYFLVYDTSIMILALPYNRAFSVQQQKYLAWSGREQAPPISKYYIEIRDG
jgi:hypothetical protein